MKKLFLLVMTMASSASVVFCEDTAAPSVSNEVLQLIENLSVEKREQLEKIILIGVCEDFTLAGDCSEDRFPQCSSPIVRQAFELYQLAKKFKKAGSDFNKALGISDSINSDVVINEVIASCGMSHDQFVNAINQRKAALLEVYNATKQAEEAKKSAENDVTVDSK